MKEFIFKIVFISCSILLLSFSYCWSQDIDFGQGINLPILGGAKDIWGGEQPLEVNGVITKAASFGVNKDIGQVFDFYKTNLAKLGWQLGKEWPEVGVIYFTKGEYFLYIVGSETLRGYSQTFLKFALVLSKRELHVCSTIALLSVPYFQEAPGRDLSFLPRYPGSIRAFNIIRKDKEAFFVYVVKDDAKKIVEFYRKNMPNYGWHLSEKFSLPHTCLNRNFSANSLIFYRDKDNITIYMSYCAESQANIVLISYNYAFNYAIWPLNVDEEW
jgi:hypothetical protein